MDNENPYSPSGCTQPPDRIDWSGWVLHLYLTAILLLIYSAGYWYLSDTHVLSESDGNLFIEPRQSQDLPQPFVDLKSRQANGVDFSISSLALSGLGSVLLANMLLWGFREIVRATRTA